MFPRLARDPTLWSIVLSGLLALITWSKHAPAATDAEASVERATAALERGAYSEAISELERLSDAGFVHPDASYNRALAYLQRAESPKKRAGDLGQAVAALREVLLSQPDASDAERALSATRREISRLRAQRGLDPVVVAPSLERAIVGLLPENVWACLTLLGSILLGVGLVLRRAELHSPRRLAGQISAAVGVGVLLLFGTLTALAAHQRESTREAVVVVDEANLLDEQGKRLSAKALDVEASAIPEGATVTVLGQSGRLVRVNWGSFEAWVPASNLRILTIAGR